MSERLGSGEYQYELVTGWAKVEIAGGVADVACDAQGRVYAGVRDRQADGKPGNIFGGGGHLLVLDRDYLHVPADDIKNIKPLMTMVGGKVVYKAQDQTRSSRPKYANAKL